jgi:hypothetical protein
MRNLLAIFVLAGSLGAQPTVAPTDERVGPARGENLGGYNVRQSWELGYRYHSVGGDEGTYRSTVNFGNGVRLLESSLAVQSRDGHGKYFDQIQLDTQGLGNDPYQNVLFRTEKNRLYRYDLRWRSNAYYNPGLRADHGQHFADTVRNFQDHDLTLLPQSAIKFFFGFSRNTQSGPGITSALLFDSRGDQYPLFANIHRQQHEYRAGFEAKLAGWRLNLLHGWVNFKEDTPVHLDGPSAGYNPNDLTSAESYDRVEPYRGNSPYWRITLFKETRLWAFNGRYTYVKGQRRFVQDSTGYGTDRFGGNITQQIFASGNADRPAAAGNLNFSVFPTQNLTVTNQTAISNIRMQGRAVITQVTDGLPIQRLPFEYLGIFTVSNATDADYRPLRWLALRAGYQYSTRRIRSQQDGLAQVEQNNTLHVGRAGVRLRPTTGLTIVADGEIGRSDRPFFPVSDRNYHAFAARAEYKRGAWRIAGSTRTRYNVNSETLSSFASHSRQYGADVTWTASRTFFIDVSYAKLHLDTLGTMNYFARLNNGPSQFVLDQSYYVSNLHTANIAAHYSLGRVDLSVGLSHVQDTGDGRATLTGTEPYGRLPGFKAAQTFPVRFTSPQAKASVRIRENLRWNLGYQHYGYAEEFSTAQDFRAHTGYTSVSWAF